MSERDPKLYVRAISTSAHACMHAQADALMEDADIGAESGDRDHARMPFELRALEVALDVVSHLAVTCCKLLWRSLI